MVMVPTTMGEPMQHLNREGIEPSVMIWQPGIVPSGLIFYSGDAFPQWRGNLMAGSIQRGANSRNRGIGAGRIRR